MITVRCDCCLKYVVQRSNSVCQEMRNHNFSFLPVWLFCQEELWGFGVFFFHLLFICCSHNAFMYVNSFDPHDNLMREHVIYPILAMKKTEAKRLARSHTPGKGKT